MDSIKTRFSKASGVNMTDSQHKSEPDKLRPEAIDQRKRRGGEKKKKKSTFIQVNILAHCPSVRYSHPEVKVKVKLPISPAEMG